MLSPWNHTKPQFLWFPEGIHFNSLTRIFFSKKRFFQPSLRVAWRFNKLSPKCCLSVAYYIEAMSYQDTLYFLHLSLYLRFGLYVLFIVIYFAIDSSIFITINHIISLIQTNLFLGHVCQCCLAFAYFFANFSLALLIKVLLIKKV